MAWSVAHLSPQRRDLLGSAGGCSGEMAAESSGPGPSLPQVDDQRRTHNYDEFICTFISMLAQEGEPCSAPWPSGTFPLASGGA